MIVIISIMLGIMGIMGIMGIITIMMTIIHQDGHIDPARPVGNRDGSMTRL